MPQFTIEYWPETNSRVEFFAATLPPELPVTAVKAYVFQGDTLLLTNIASRGWDLPGGHIEPGETPKQALIRELHEEAGAKVGRFDLIGYLKVTNEKENDRNRKYPKVSCILVYRGYEATLDTDHDFQLEASECKFVPVDQLPQVHHNWNAAKAEVVDYAFGYKPAVETHMIQVFTNAQGDFGDIASVVIDQDRHIPDAVRQDIAHKLNTGETIFINDLSAADISVMHPQGEIGFAGVGVLATAWLLAKLRDKPTDKMQARDGEITAWQEGDLTWVRGSLSIMPPWDYRQLENAEAVEQVKLEDTNDWPHTMAWAWIDEVKGLIRARTFAADWDIPEAQGNGSGSMVLAAKLGRAIEIRHGEGAVIFAKQAPDGQADIGGRVTEEINAG